jgi:hypothetical protein
MRRLVRSMPAVRVRMQGQGRNTRCEEGGSKGGNLIQTLQIGPIGVEDLIIMLHKRIPHLLQPQISNHHPQ